MKLLIVVVFALSITNAFAQTNDTIRYKIPKTPFKQEETVTVLPEDTTYLRISFENKKWKLKLKKGWEQLSSLNELDKFIAHNKTFINSKKILVIMSSKSLYKDFKPLIAILKKHDYLSFHIVPTD